MDPLHLLVVDDDDVDRERVRRMLVRACPGAEVVEAACAEEALQHLRERACDCVLLDYHLGEVIGIELVPSIRRESLEACPVIMITGVSSATVAVQAIREGVYDYLPKDRLNAEILERSIQASLLRFRIEREAEAAQKRLEQLSLYDSLTGLPNRSLFNDRLERAVLASRRGGAPFAVLMMDLNLFKQVNDTMGHEAGDRVLAEVGRRLQQVLRKSDTAARLGGDEFAALLVGTQMEEGCAVVKAKIAEAMRAPIQLGEQQATIGISIGAALFPEHGEDSRSLLEHADQAMYRAKRAGRGATDARSGAPARSAPDLAGRVAQALERQEIFLLYQPKIDLASRRVIGLEALARWESSDLGLLLPLQFIAPLGQSSVLETLNFAVLDRALAQQALWQAQGIAFPLSVNLSARLIDDAQLPARVAQLLAQHGVNASALTLELKEEALLAHPRRAHEVLHALQEIGVSIALDDFGAGCSSLLALRELPLAELKIDPLFVAAAGAGTREAAMLEAIAALAGALGARALAEGVEDARHWAVLQRLGLHAAQGYSIAPPMPAAEVAAWTANWTARHAPRQGAPVAALAH